MNITDIKVFPVNEERLKAYVTIVLENSFLVRDLKVIHGPGGYFVAMPSKKRKDGTYKDLAHPINAATREAMEKTILEAYHKQAAEGSAGRGPSRRDDEDSTGASETPSA